MNSRLWMIKPWSLSTAAVLGILLAAAPASPGAMPGSWQTLEGCQLVANVANTADRLHVAHGGQEYVFQLYAVEGLADADVRSAPVVAQAAAFELEPPQIARLGKLAAKTAALLLREKPFTILTCWEPASRRDKVSYAFVRIGRQDLGTELVRRGLARGYGRRASTPAEDWREYQRALSAAATQAQAARAGLWELRAQPGGNLVRDTGYRLSPGGIRHNPGCPFYHRRDTTACAATDGLPCARCGG